MYAPVYRVELVRDGRREIRSRCISEPQHIAQVLRRHIGQSDRELFVVMGFDSKSRIIGISTVSMGTLESTAVHPRELFKPLILMNAARAAVGHNHPSGDPTPSSNDFQVTRRLIQAGNLLGIEIVDHVIIGSEGVWYSMRSDASRWPQITKVDRAEELLWR